MALQKTYENNIVIIDIIKQEKNYVVKISPKKLIKEGGGLDSENMIEGCRNAAKKFSEGIWETGLYEIKKGEKQMRANLPCAPSTCNYSTEDIMGEKSEKGINAFYILPFYNESQGHPIGLKESELEAILLSIK